MFDLEKRSLILNLPGVYLVLSYNSLITVYDYYYIQSSNLFILLGLLDRVRVSSIRVAAGHLPREVRATSFAAVVQLF